MWPTAEKITVSRHISLSATLKQYVWWQWQHVCICNIGMCIRILTPAYICQMCSKVSCVLHTRYICRHLLGYMVAILGLMPAQGHFWHNIQLARSATHPHRQTDWTMYTHTSASRGISSSVLEHTLASISLQAIFKVQSTDIIRTFSWQRSVLILS